MLIILNTYLDKRNYISLKEYLRENYKYLIPILIGNGLMLLFGLLGELKIINCTIGIILGWIPFIFHFKKIYDNDLSENKNDTSNKRCLYWFFVITWSFYGIAAFFPYVIKNTMYNILDLFSKNILGLILVYLIWKNQKSK